MLSQSNKLRKKNLNAKSQTLTNVKERKISDVQMLIHHLMLNNTTQILHNINIITALKANKTMTSSSKALVISVCEGEKHLQSLEQNLNLC